MPYIVYIRSIYTVFDDFQGFEAKMFFVFFLFNDCTLWSTGFLLFLPKIITLFAKKTRARLHISFFFCTFAAAKVLNGKRYENDY